MQSLGFLRNSAFWTYYRLYGSGSFVGPGPKCPYSRQYAPNPFSHTMIESRKGSFQVAMMSIEAKRENTAVRHVDRGRLLGTFASEAIVVCPKCAGPAVVTSRSTYTTPYVPTQAKLVCLKCPFQTTLDESGWLGPGVGIARERCPNCGFKWLESRVRRGSLKGQGRRWTAITCSECQHTTKVPLRWRITRIGAAVDPAFGLPLWLQSSCCGETLWAYNAAHLNALRDYVAAAIRERVGVMQWSMFSRLPKWLSARKNRDTVLSSIDRLQERLPSSER
jgi:hypothetical protein